MLPLSGIMWPLWDIMQPLWGIMLPLWGIMQLFRPGFYTAATRRQPAGNPAATPGKDNLTPAEDLHNKNPSLVALGKN